MVRWSIQSNKGENSTFIHTKQTTFDTTMVLGCADTSLHLHDHHARGLFTSGEYQGHDANAAMWRGAEEVKLSVYTSIYAPALSDDHELWEIADTSGWSFVTVSASGSAGYQFKRCFKSEQKSFHVVGNEVSFTSTTPRSSADPYKPAEGVARCFPLWGLFNPPM